MEVCIWQLFSFGFVKLVFRIDAYDKHKYIHTLQKLLCGIGYKIVVLRNKRSALNRQRYITEICKITGNFKLCNIT